MTKLKRFQEFVGESLTTDELSDLEKFADSLFQELGVDVVFTKHFKERVNDARNGRPITYTELKNMFLKAYLRAGQYISELPAETEAVIKDMSSNLNSPFIIHDSPGDDSDVDHDMVMKTIMRKERFMSNNPTIPV
jgi:hypothetical protein